MQRAIQWDVTHGIWGALLEHLENWQHLGLSCHGRSPTHRSPGDMQSVCCNDIFAMIFKLETPLCSPSLLPAPSRPGLWI